MSKELTPEQIKKLKADKAIKVNNEEIIVKSVDIKSLVENKADHVALKKAANKFCDPSVTNSTSEAPTFKMFTSSSSDDLEAGKIKRTVVGNTYGWFDSHKDVHIPGIFSKSISENKNIFHLHDHLQQVTAKVGTPLKVYEQSIPLSQLGVNKIGTANCLLMDSEIKKSYNPMVYEEYLNKQIQQHSVGMRYVQLHLCVNNEEYKEEFANWNTYKNYVINLKDAEDNGYFWAVTEAKLVEISAVLKGSNELTPTIDVKNEPLTGTQDKIEPGKTTQNKVNYNYLLTKLKS